MVGRHFKSSPTYAPFQGFAERSNASGLTGHEVPKLNFTTRVSGLKVLTSLPTRLFQS